MKDYKLWYQKRKRELTQGGLWLRGEEINVSFDYDKFPILISRLSTYRDIAFIHIQRYRVYPHTEIPLYP
ncbi:MAG: hypothetical protein KA885_06140 [Spirochaetes bacterium]|nr:hypothetical protein [Spirochaetota bacterium]